MNKKQLVYKFLMSDIFASLIVWVLFIIFRRMVNDARLFPNVQIFVPNFDYLTSLALFPVSCVIIHYLSGFYLRPERQNYVSLFLVTFTASIIISLSIFFVLMLNDIVISYSFYYYSLLVLFLLLFVFTFFFRSIIISGIKRNFKTGKWSVNTVVIGTGKNALKLAGEFDKNNYRNKFIGFVQIDSKHEVEKEKIIGNFNQIEQLIKDRKLEEAILALDEADEQKLFTYINSLYKYNINIRFTPRLYEILTGSARIGNLGISPLVSITSLNMPDWQICVKRFADIFISLLSMIVFSPLFMFFIIRIKSDSKGPVFYTQERVGLHGKIFKILKFRTMHVGSERGVPKLSSANDDRITNVGRILRKYRIDELPQFWNILKGEMSLVGPRPERKFYINKIVEQAPYYCLLYKIRPGLTSWGPIKIGYSDTVDKMIERLNYDIVYLENMSLLNDLKILILTIEIIFRGKGV